MSTNNGSMAIKKILAGLRRFATVFYGSPFDKSHILVSFLNLKYRLLKLVQVVSLILVRCASKLHH